MTELPSPALRAIWARQARLAGTPAERIKYALLAAGVTEDDAEAVMVDFARNFVPWYTGGDNHAEA